MFNLHEPLITTAIIVGAPLVGLALHSVLVSVVRRTHRRRPFSISGLPLHVTHWFASFRLLIPSAMLAAAAPLLPAPATVRSTVTHVAVLGIIAGAAWVVTSTLAVARDIAMIHLQLQSADNLRGRRIFTQLRIIEQIATAATLIVALSFMLMTFSGVRQIGADLLASAGLVGLVLGLAAQRSIATILAGMQIAFNQPIRLDDVVVVEGESGRIEEITLTYVVVHIWDHRRLILPVTYFIERPFQNWTRTTAEWVAIFDKLDVPAMPYHTFESLLEDPHLADVGLIGEVAHPTEGRIKNVNVPNRWSSARRADYRPPPKIGQHSVEILREAGYAPEWIRALAGRKVIVDGRLDAT